MATITVTAAAATTALLRRTNLRSGSRGTPPRARRMAVEVTADVVREFVHRGVCGVRIGIERDEEDAIEMPRRARRPETPLARGGSVSPVRWMFSNGRLSVRSSKSSSEGVDVGWRWSRACR